jgi:hypothetical protein
MCNSRVIAGFDGVSGRGQDVTMSAAFTCLLVATALAGGSFALSQRREAPGCQASIVSSSVVATYCGHAENGDDVLDLLILWRGGAG